MKRGRAEPGGEGKPSVFMGRRKKLTVFMSRGQQFLSVATLIKPLIWIDNSLHAYVSGDTRPSS